MSVKTITITENAYRILASKKKENDSFSKVIERELGKGDIMDIVGILSKKEGEDFKKRVYDAKMKSEGANRKKLENIRREMGHHS